MNVTSLLADITPNLCIEHTDEGTAMDRIRRSMKFEIDLSSEAYGVAMDYGFQMQDFGIFVLPFPECYFEMSIEADESCRAHSIGAVAWTEDGEIRARGYQIEQNGSISGGCTFSLARQ